MSRFLLVCSCALVLAACAKTPAMMSSSLDGSEWVLARVETADGTMDRQPDTTPTLRFEGDRVSGSDGCNTFNVSVRMTDGGMAFGPLAMTRMACPPDVEAVAGPVGMALSEQEVRTEMMLDGQELKLTSGDVALYYVRADGM